MKLKSGPKPGTKRPPFSAEWRANISKAKKGRSIGAHRKGLCKYGHDMSLIGARNKYGQCVECLHVYQRTYKQAYMVKNRSAIAAANREKRYGLSMFDYAEMAVKQDGKCAICEGMQKGKKVDLEVDHDHETGKVRALLCTACNVLLGRLEKSPQLIEKMVAYLKEHRATSMTNN